jgi:hypothetical protein
MKLWETGLGETMHIAVNTPDGAQAIQREVRLERHSITNAWQVADAAGGVARVEPANPQAEERLRLVLERGGSTFVYFDWESDRRGALHTHGWRHILRDDRVAELRIPPELAEKIPESGRKNLTAWWEEEMTAEHRGERWAFVFQGKGARAEEEELDDAFTFVGREWQIQVKSITERDGKTTYIGQSIKRSRKPRRELLAFARSIQPVVARVDATQVYNQAPADRLQESAFLRDWNTYRSREKELIEAEAARMGEVRYDHCKVDGRHFVFTLQDPPDANWQSPRRPVQIAVVQPKREISLGDLQGRDGASPNRIRVEIDQFDESPPKVGVLRVSTRGHGARLQRHEEALNRVLEGQSDLPDLLDVLEGRGRQQQVDPIRQPLSAAVEAQLSRKLTPAQVQAIGLAINTPDILLIQGPPGTGKTSVIRAIAQRLHEEGRQPVLVCSHQHEAVLNVIEGMSIGGLPVPRIGERRGEDLWSALRHIWTWVEEVMHKAEEGARSLPTDPAAAIRERLWADFVAWQAAPAGKRPVRALLRGVEETAGAYLGPFARQQVHAAIDVADQPPRLVDPRRAEDRARLHALVDRQRRSLEAWSDDGPTLARRLLRCLHDDAGCPKVLVDRLASAAAQPAEEGPPADWEVLLQDLRGYLSAEEAEEDRTLEQRAESAVLAALDDLDMRARRQGEGLADALLRLADRLQRDPSVVNKIIQNHSTVLGSTASQSASKAMVSLKAHFDTIIVDEAARASPLDLLVPLARARRIILVGDQMQLPHMLEPALEEVYEKEGERELLGRLQEGLFQRLWGRYDASPPGGIRRTVLLDRQFRMHPTIGSLVSRCFYAGALQNGVSAEERPAVTSLSPCPIACFDVPRSHGPERSTPSGSRYRTVEVDRVVDLVQGAVEAESPDLTIGVISFYAEQIRRIREELDTRGLGDRVQVGTVDAFQGRDFDVVLLSCVRSGGSVGFLALPNRLNVAMSRARRFLGVVGDLSTICVIPAFQELVETARGQEVHIA